MKNPLGATKNERLKLSFDRRLMLEFHGARISSDAGLLAYREMDEVLGLTTMSGRMLNDWRTGKNTQHSMLAIADWFDAQPLQRSLCKILIFPPDLASTSSINRFANIP
jgi:hypothetical protein